MATQHILKQLIYNSNIYDGAIETTSTVDCKYKTLPFVRNLTKFIVSLFKNVQNLKIANYNFIKTTICFQKLKTKHQHCMAIMRFINCLAAIEGQATHPNGLNRESENGT